MRLTFGYLQDLCFAERRLLTNSLCTWPITSHFSIADTPNLDHSGAHGANVGQMLKFGGLTLPGLQQEPESPQPDFATHE